MITTFYPPYNFGGDGIFVQQLAVELVRRGHGVEVVHCIDSYRLLSGDHSEKKYDESAGVTVHGLKSKAGFLSPLLTHQTGRPGFKHRQLERILARGFDVIHYHNLSLVGGPKALGLGNGIKLCTLHEYWLLCPTNLLYTYRKSVCSRKSCVVCQLAQKRPPQWWRYTGLLRSQLRHIDTFIAPSRFSKTRHQQEGIVQPIIHLPNFTVKTAQEDSPDPEIYPAKAASPYFLFVGRLEWTKGPHTLVAVFARFSAASLLIAGVGAQEADLKAAARGHEHIRFLGSRSLAELQDLYRNAVAVIVPSLWFENHPLVILEAFQCKTPVIARNIGALAEILNESKAGILYDTERELIDAMHLLVADSGYRNHLGRNGYAAYQKEWSVDTYMDRYLALIERLGEPH